MGAPWLPKPSEDSPLTEHAIAACVMWKEEDACVPLANLIAVMLDMLSRDIGSPSSFTCVDNVGGAV